ncbi:MAG: hypothetical protein R3A11_04545 [Bdellovibrionota bacterium]
MKIWLSVLLASMSFNSWTWAQESEKIHNVEHRLFEQIQTIEELVTWEEQEHSLYRGQIYYQWAQANDKNIDPRVVQNWFHHFLIHQTDQELSIDLLQVENHNPDGFYSFAFDFFNRFCATPASCEECKGMFWTSRIRRYSQATDLVLLFFEKLAMHPDLEGLASSLKKELSPEQIHTLIESLEHWIAYLWLPDNEEIASAAVKNLIFMLLQS